MNMTNDKLQYKVLIMKKFALFIIFNIYIISQITAHPGHGLEEVSVGHLWFSTTHFGLIWVSMIILLMAASMKKRGRETFQ
jgi:hypothetical protein